MAGDRVQFLHAKQKWDMLAYTQNFSVLPEVGTALVFQSEELLASDYEPISYYALQEPAEILPKLQRFHRKVALINTISVEGLQEAVTDRNVASIVLLGEGAASFVYVDGSETGNESVDWRDISAWSTHLKTGIFLQRFCGNYLRRLSVPLGTFLLANTANLFAPFGQNYNPETDWYGSEEAKIKALYRTKNCSTENF